MPCCQCALQMKLFIISLITILEVAYQIVLLHELLFPWYFSARCSIKEVRLNRILAVFAFIYDPSLCGPKNVYDFTEKGALKNLTNFEFTFISHVNQLGPPPSAFLPKAVLAIFIIWQILDYLLMWWSVSLFCLCYCTNLIKRKACYYIVFPWLIQIAAVIFFDIATISFSTYLYSVCQSVVSFIKLIGYSEKKAAEFEKYEPYFEDSYNETLTYLPKRLLYISCRHGFAVEMFAVFFVIVFRVALQAYREKEKPQVTA